MAMRTIAFLCFGLWLILNQGTFLSRALVACFYLFFFFCMIQAGTKLKDKEKLIAQILVISGTIVGLTGWIQYFNVPFLGLRIGLIVDIPGMSGIVGQRNIFANWIACSMMALLFLEKEEEE